VLLVDADNRVCLANPAFGQAFGLDPAGLVGNHLLEALPDAVLLTAVLEMTPQAQAGGPQSRDLADAAGRAVRLNVAAAPSPAGQAMLMIVLGRPPQGEANP